MMEETGMKAQVIEEILSNEFIISGRFVCKGKR